MPTYTAVAGGGNWNSAATWTGGTPGAFPTTGDTAILNATSGQVTVTANATCLILNCTGYVNTLTINTGFTLTVSGTGATISLGGTISTLQQGELSTIGSPGGSCTVNFNGVTIPRLRIGTNNTGVFCTTVIGTGTTPTVQNLNAVPFTGGNSAITNGTLTVTNSISVSSGAITGGTTTTGSLLISGNCSINTVGTAFLNIPLTIPNGSTLTVISSTFRYGTGVGGGATLTFNSGSTLNIGTSLLNIIGQGTILNTSNVTWYDVQVNGNSFQTTTLTSNLNISRNLSIVTNTHGFTSSGGSFNVIVGGGLSIGTGLTFILNNTNVILTGTNSGTNIIDGGTIQGNGVATSKISITGSNYQIGTASKLTLGILSITFELSPITPTAAATVVSGHTLAISGSFTLTTNNTATGANIGGTEIIWNNITQTVNTAITITYDTTTTGNLANTSIGTAIFNGGKISFGGNLSTTGTGIFGTSTLEFSGPNNATWGAGTYQNNVTINKSGIGAVLLPTGGTITWGAAGRVLQRTAGNINASTSTVAIINIAVTISNMIFNNLTITGGASTVITQNTANTINSILQLNGSTTFAGTAGWTCATLINTTANTTITLQNSVTYRTTTGVQLVSTAAQPITMVSNNASIRAIWTLDAGATQNIIYVNGTRIDSSGGQTIWTFGGIISTTPVGAETLNWRTGTRPGTIAYVFLN